MSEPRSKIQIAFDGGVGVNAATRIERDNLVRAVHDGIKNNTPIKFDTVAKVQLRQNGPHVEARGTVIINDPSKIVFVDVSDWPTDSGIAIARSMPEA